MLCELLLGKEIKEKCKEEELVLKNELSSISNYGIYYIDTIETKEGITTISVKQCLPSESVVKAIKEIF